MGEKAGEKEKKIEHQERARLTTERQKGREGGKKKEKGCAEWIEQVYRSCGEEISRVGGAVFHRVR